MSFTTWSLGVYKHDTKQQKTVSEYMKFNSHRISTYNCPQPTCTSRDFK